MNDKLAFVSLIVTLIINLVGCSDNNTNQTYTPKELSVQAIGTATGIPTTEILPGTDIEVTGNAFTMDFFDKQTGEHLGTVTDINVKAETFEDGSMK